MRKEDKSFGKVGMIFMITILPYGSLISSVASNLNVFATVNKLISMMSHQMKVLMDNNTIDMKDATNGMLEIALVTKESHQIMLWLMRNRMRLPILLR